jgi:hypothetical protein
MLRFVWLGAAVFFASSVACIAGPCGSEIGAMQARLNNRLDAAAAVAPQAAETPQALRHQQPTQRSLVSALIALGVVSPKKAKIIGMSMMRANEADEANDLVACERALASVDRTIGE